MKKYKILVLTDHKTHGKGESIYRLLIAMNKNVYCENIFVATRGDGRNKIFYEHFDAQTVFAKKVDDQFQFTINGTWYLDSISVNISEFDILFLRIDQHPRKCLNTIHKPKYV